MDERSKRPEASYADTRPLFDVIQALWINLFLLGVYSLLLLWSISSVVLIVVFPNIDWPMTFAVACATTTLLVHFLIVCTGVILVRGYQAYPLLPRMMYQFVDFGLGLIPVLIISSYLVRASSSTVPLVGSFLIASCLVITVHKIVVIARGVRSRDRDPVTGARV